MRPSPSRAVDVGLPFLPGLGDRLLAHLFTGAMGSCLCDAMEFLCDPRWNPRSKVRAVHENGETAPAEPACSTSDVRRDFFRA